MKLFFFIFQEIYIFLWILLLTGNSIIQRKKKHFHITTHWIVHSNMKSFVALFNIVLFLILHSILVFIPNHINCIFLLYMWHYGYKQKYLKSMIIMEGVLSCRDLNKGIFKVRKKKQKIFYFLYFLIRPKIYNKRSFFKFLHANTALKK